MRRVDFALRRDDGHDVVVLVCFLYDLGGRHGPLWYAVVCSFSPKTDVPDKKLNKNEKQQAKARIFWLCQPTLQNTIRFLSSVFIFFLVHDTHTLTLFSKRRDTNRREFRLHVYGRVCCQMCAWVKTLDVSSGLHCLKRSVGLYLCCCCAEAKHRTCFELGWRIGDACLVCYEDCLWLFPFRLPLSGVSPLWVISAEFQYMNVSKGYFSVESAYPTDLIEKTLNGSLAIYKNQ